MGELSLEASGDLRFRRGVRAHPAIGDGVHMLSSAELRAVYSRWGNNIEIGGSAKTRTFRPVWMAKACLRSTLPSLDRRVWVSRAELPFILNASRKPIWAFGFSFSIATMSTVRCFGKQAYVTGVTDLRLPFWLFNFEEVVDVIYGGRPSSRRSRHPRRAHPLAKGMYQNLKAGLDRKWLRRPTRQNGFTAVSHTPYLLQDLINLIASAWASSRTERAV